MTRRAKALHWDDERSLGNSLIVTTKPGWAFRPSADERMAEHVRGFDTVKEAETALRLAPSCSCSRCKNGED